MASNDDGQNRGGGFGGPRPTSQLRGVQFLGQPAAQPAGNQFHIKRPDGRVSGPHEAAEITSMAQSGQLTGEEGVSRDGQFWIPITAAPEFGMLFRAAGGGPARTMVGGLAAIGQAPPAPGPSAGDAALSGSYPSFGMMDDDYDLFADGGTVREVPRQPAPLAQSGLGLAADSSAARMASGAWSSLPGSSMGDDLSVSKAIAPDPDALSGVPGVRRLTGANPSLPVADRTTPSLPQGFGALGEPLEASGELPLPPGPLRGSALPPARAGQGGFVDAERPTALRPSGFGDLQAAAELPVAVDRTDALIDLPIARGDLPPSPAQNLPRPATGALPPIVGGSLPTPSYNLPGSGGGLPRPAQNLPGVGGTVPVSSANAPGSTLTAPDSRATWGDASGLNLSGLLDPNGGNRGQGTQMMSAFGIDEVELPSAVDSRGRAAELPTSTRSGGSILDSLADVEDVWAEQGAVGAAGVGIAEGRQTQASDPFGFGDDPFASLQQPPSSGDEFSGFFAAGAPADAEAAPAAAPEASAAAPAEALRPRPPSAVPRVAVAAAIGLAVLGGAGAALWYFVIRTPVVEPPPQVVVAPEPTVVVSAEAALPEITELRRATWNEMDAYAQQGRQAIAVGRNNTDRARTMVAIALMAIDNPNATELVEELNRLHGELEADDTSSAAVLARVAWAATTTAEDPSESVAEVLQSGAPAEKAFAHLFAALYDVQRARGVTFEAPAAAPAEGSGSAAVVAEGSAAAAGTEGSAAGAPAEAAPAPVEPAPEVVAIDIPELDASVLSKIDAAVAADSELVAARYWRGVVALELGDSVAAGRAFEQAIELQPQHVGALVGLTRSLLSQGRLGEADGRVQRAIDELESVSARHERGATFLASGEVAIARIQPELAIESLLSALQVDPGNPEALELLGDQFVEAGQFQRALEYFLGNSDLVEQEPEAALGLVKAYLGIGSLDDAESAAETAAERFPTDGRFPYQLGQVAERRTEFDVAEEHYRRALQVDGEFLLPWVALSNLQARGGESQQARATLGEAFALPNRDASVANAIGEQYLAIGETNLAVTAFRRAIDLNRAFARARTNLTDYYLATNQHQRALAELQNMLDSGVDSPRVRFLHARALGEEGQHARAIEEVLALLEDDANNSEYTFLLGRLQFYQGLNAKENGDTAAAARAWEAAAAQIQRTLTLSPSHEGATYYLGRVEIETGAYNSAITSLTTVSDRSNRGEYHYWLGYALELADQATQALQEYGRAIVQDVGWSLENPEVFYRRGRLLQIRGALGGAYRDLQIALTLRPDHAEAAWVLGRVYFEERRWSEAIASIEHSIAVQPNQPMAHYYAGRAYLNRGPGDANAALAHLEAARAGGIADRFPDVHQRLGYLYRDMNRRPEAVESFRSYLAVANIPYEERRATENEIRRLGAQP